MGNGFVDGVTFNLTNSTTSKCKNEFQNVGHIVDDAKNLFQNFTVPNLFGFLEGTTSTWFIIAANCQFSALYWNILHSSNIFVLVPRVFKILIFKIPALIKGELSLL